MIEVFAIAGVLIAAAIITAWIFIRPPGKSTQSISPMRKHPQDSSYFPGIQASSAGPLPLRGRESREKTETFKRNE